MTSINRDEWLKALHDATHAPLPESDAITAVEFGDLIGVQRAQAYKRLVQMEKAGKATRTTKPLRRSDGSVVTVAAYRLVK